MFPATDDELELAFEHETEFLALVLEVASAAAAGREVIQMAFQKITGRMRGKRFDFVALAIRASRKPRSRRGAHHDVAGMACLSEKLSHREPQSRCQTLQHFQRRACA